MEIKIKQKYFVQTMFKMRLMEYYFL